MQDHLVRTHRSDEPLPRAEQLAWLLARVAADAVEVDPDVTEMIINRLIDNAAVSAASLLRRPVTTARAQARAHPPATGPNAGGHGATVVGATVVGANVVGANVVGGNAVGANVVGANVVGLPAGQRFSPEWAAWANGVAVRELDFHDTFLAAEYSHPGDNIPPVLAVAQHAGCSGRDLVRGIATGYEVQVDLTRSISLHRHKIDHVAHLGPSAAAGIGTLLGLDVPVIYQAIGQALHTTTATRQSRKGEISSWKAYAPALAGKAAIEAVDRAMRGESSPTPIYEGEDGVIAWLLDGPDGRYSVPLPEPGEAKRAILSTYTKQHSAEYQAQALIDLARRLHREHPETADPDRVAAVVIHTSRHTHEVIGSGAGDPQKYDPRASRETLDHSIPYIFAVALQDGAWDHVRSYTPQRAGRGDTVALWRKITTTEDPEWTRRYHSTDPAEQAFGGRVEIEMTNGQRIVEEIAVADAHPLGAAPFGRADYIDKFRVLSADVLAPAEAQRFLDLVQRLPELDAADLLGLTITARPGLLETVPEPKGLF